MLTEAGPATREVGEAAGPLAEAWAAGAALREAEQLMAHTEPEAIRADGAIFAGWQTISTRDAERQARGGRLGMEERAALAEALEAFVLDCPVCRAVLRDDIRRRYGKRPATTTVEA